MGMVFGCLYRLSTCYKCKKETRTILALRGLETKNHTDNLTEEEIQCQARKMLNQWKVTVYANNKFLYKIPEAREREQLKKFIKELSDKHNLHFHKRGSHFRK